MREKVEESLASRMEPTWMRSECGRLDARLERVDAMKECAIRSRRKPFKVILYFDGSFNHEFFVDSIEEGHYTMRKYVEKE